MIVATVSFDLEIDESWKADEQWVRSFITCLFDDLNENNGVVRMEKATDFLNAHDRDGMKDSPDFCKHDITVIMGRRR